MINKNDKLVIFLSGSVRCRYGFLTETCRMEGENHIYSSPWKRNINYRIKCVVELFSEIQELTAEPLYYIDKFTFYLYNYPVMV